MAADLHFPDPRELARRRAEKFQRLSPEARWRELASLMAFGYAMIKASPNREEIERRVAEEEQRWREIQQELFKRHIQQSIDLMDANRTPQLASDELLAAANQE